MCKEFWIFGSYYKPLRNSGTVMSQSLSILYIHATFGTKGRNLWINEKIAPDLHAYMASILKILDSPALIINSMPDHIHVLFRISKTVTVA